MEKLMKALVSFLLAATAAVAAPPVNPQSKISSQLLTAAKSLGTRMPRFSSRTSPTSNAQAVEHYS